MIRSDDIGVQSFDFFKKVEKWVLRAIIFFYRFKIKNQIFLWLEYKNGIENLVLRPLRPLSEVIIPPTSSAIINEFFPTGWNGHRGAFFPYLVFPFFLLIYFSLSGYFLEFWIFIQKNS